ncbi:MAG: glutamate racemase [Succinivibrio sp.]
MSESKVKVKRVLFFDSGVGGLSIYKAVKELNPKIEAYYLFDNECFPYGDKSDDFIIDRVESLIEKACRQFELSAVVVACNTASTIALPELRGNISIPIVGVVPAIKPAAAVSKNRIIGLLATPGTVSREYTKDLIKNFASDCEVISVGDARLAKIAEQRLSTGYVHEGCIKEIISPFLNRSKELQPDTVVLGCTHYPFVKDVLSKFMPACRFIDSGEAIGRRVKTVISESDSIEVDSITDRAFYTGELANYKERLQMVTRFGFDSLEPFR